MSATYIKIFSPETFVPIHGIIFWHFSKISEDIFTIIRPPGTVVREVFNFAGDVFRRQISELPRPITAKLRHMIGTCVSFIN